MSCHINRSLDLTKPIKITSIEPIYDGADVFLRIRGYDRGHRLTHGKATRTYGDGNPTGAGIGDSDIVSKIAKDAGILTVGVVTKPFLFEGSHRSKSADKGIEALQQYVSFSSLSLQIFSSDYLYILYYERIYGTSFFRVQKRG